MCRVNPIPVLMKTTFTLLLLLLLFNLRTEAQTCDSLQITYSVSESRCMATGSITANVTGGSGNYNYMVQGPVITPFTVSNNISGLEKGYYKLIVRDIVNDCSTELDSIYVPGNYQDPRFQVIKTNVNCTNTNGTITAVNAQFGRPPFSYTIVAPSTSGSWYNQPDRFFRFTRGR
jgi:hypothetical protein